MAPMLAGRRVVEIAAACAIAAPTAYLQLIAQATDRDPTKLKDEDCKLEEIAVGAGAQGIAGGAILHAILTAFDKATVKAGVRVSGGGGRVAMGAITVGAFSAAYNSGKEWLRDYRLQEEDLVNPLGSGLLTGAIVMLPYGEMMPVFMSMGASMLLMPAYAYGWSYLMEDRELPIMGDKVKTYDDSADKNAEEAPPPPVGKPNDSASKVHKLRSLCQKLDLMEPQRRKNLLASAKNLLKELRSEETELRKERQVEADMKARGEKPKPKPKAKRTKAEEEERERRRMQGLYVEEDDDKPKNYTQLLVLKAADKKEVKEGIKKLERHGR